MTHSSQRDRVSAPLAPTVRRGKAGFGTMAYCLLVVTSALPGVALSAPNPFYIGADISLETYMQQQNVQFSDSIGQAPLDTIMYDHGANLFRLRIFVNPQTTYNSTNVGAIQSQAYDIALAQQIKANCPTAKIVLNFHYSDTWADPGKQFKPQNLAGTDPATDWRNMDLPTLNATVQNYTRDTLNAFKTSGVMPDLVQIGNETTGGMLWQTGATGGAAAGGRILFQNNSYPGLGLTNNRPTQAQTDQSWRDFGGLLNSAIAGVRQVQSTGPRIPVVLSIDHGDRAGQPQSFYANIQSPTLGNVTDFDIQGVDYYPTSGNLATTMNSNLTALANTNYNNFLADTSKPLKKIMLLETNSPWEAINNVGDANQFPKTPAGQQAEMQAMRDLIYNLPHDDGEGVLWWYPEAVSPVTSYNNGATALFDSTVGSNVHYALPALSVLESLLVPGDADFDGQVTMSDLDVIRGGFGMGPNARRLNGDLNRDGVVDLSDFAFWKELYTASGGAGAAAAGGAVPEPSSLALLAFAMASLIRRRRNR